MGELSYLAFLATRLPPSSLANAVRRRTARRLRQVIATGTPEAPSDRVILAALGAQDLSELPVAMVIRDVPSWANPRRTDELRDVARRCSGFAERALGRADAIARRELQVFGRAVQVADRGAWSRDPVSHAAWPLQGSPQRSREVSDPKRVWALGRMDWAVALAQATWLADGEAQRAYELAFEEMACELLDQSPYGQGIHWATAMEVSLRGANLAAALAMLRGTALPGATWLRLLRSVWEHAAFTHQHLEDTGAVPNNHLVAGLSGLLQMALLFPELPGAAQWRKEAATGLVDQAQIQVLGDGMGFEGSVGYHRLLLELLVSAWCAAPEAPALLGHGFGEILVRMFEASRRYLSPEGEAPLVGDDDSGRGLALTERPDRNHGYLPSLGAALFERSSLKAPGASFPDEAAWLLGMPGYRTFLRLRPTAREPVQCAKSFGLAALTLNDRSLTLACCGNGQRGVGGHGHNDKLAIEVRAAGRPVVVDAGTGTYADPIARDRFRGTAMHSTVQVDGLEQSPWAASRVFALPDLAQARLEGCGATPEGAFAEGSHVGYARAPLGAHHRRRAELVLAADAALITDDLQGPDGGLSAQAHRVTSRFHLPDSYARLRALEPPELERLRALGSYDWYLDRAFELGPPGAPTALWVIAGPPGGIVALEPSEHALGYDQRIPTLCLEAEWSAPLPLRLACALLFTPLRTTGPSAKE